MERFLELLQDYCLHVCLTCDHNYGDGADGHTSFHERKQHAHLLRQPDRSVDTRVKSLCRLYHSHSVVSAILSAKQLVMGGGKKGGGGTPLIKGSTLVTLSKEDNSGMHGYYLLLRVGRFDPVGTVPQIMFLLHVPQPLGIGNFCRGCEIPGHPYLRMKCTSLL